MIGNNDHVKIGGKKSKNLPKRHDHLTPVHVKDICIGANGKIKKWLQIISK